MSTPKRAAPSMQSGAIPSQLLRAALDAVSARIALMDSSGTMLYVNQAWERFARENGLASAGYTVGGNYLQLCASAVDESGGQIASGLQEVLEQRQDEFCLEYWVYGQDRPQWFRLRATRFSSDDRPWLVVVHEDVSEEKQKEECLRQNELRLRRFHQITHDTGRTLEERIERLLALGCETFGLDLGILARIDGTAYTVERVSPPDGGISRGTVFDLAQTYCEKTLLADGPVSFVHAATSEWASHPCYQAFRLEAYLAAPLRAGGKSFGTLNFSSLKPRQRPFTEADRAFLEVMAQWVEAELEQRLAEQALRESEERLAAILRHAPVPIFLKDRDGRYLLVSEEYFRVSGLSQGGVVGKTDYDLFPAPVADTLREVDRRVLDSGAALELEESVPLQGKTHHFLVVKFPLFDRAGKAYALAGIATDITELKAAQRSLEETTRLQQAILDSANYGIISIDDRGLIRTFNRAAERMLGYAAEEVVGKVPPALFHDSHELAQRTQTGGAEAEDEGGIRALVAKAQSGVPDEGTWTYVRKDGSRFPVLLSVTALRDEKGRLAGGVGIFSDVTERMRLEGRAARAQANELSRAVINAMGEGVIGLDSELQITFVNPKAEQLLALSEGELCGQRVYDAIFGPRDATPPGSCPLHEVVEGGRTVQVDDAHFFRHNGERFPVSYIASPIHEGGRVTGAALSFQDISLRRAAEDALQHHMVELARINAELDEFTFVASHDLQEPLRKLLAFSDWLRRDLGDERSPRVDQDLEFIVDAVNRMQGLVQDLLALSRAGRTSLSRQWVKLATVAQQAVENLDVAVQEKRAQIESDALPEVWGDPTMLTQLYQNLIGNALKFGGAQAPRIRLTAWEENGQWVFGVEDNGIGLKPEYSEQIFQPFKRLHGRGKYEGSGIGLSICRKVVERHGGHIWVESEEGRGAHFRFTLGGGGHDA